MGIIYSIEIMSNVHGFGDYRNDGPGQGPQYG